MSASINRQSPHGIAGFLSVLVAGAGEYEGGQLKMMLLTDSNDLSETAVWEAVEELDDGGYTLGEYTHTTGTTARKSITDVVISPTGGSVTVTCTSPTWATLTTPDSGDISHALVYWEKDGIVGSDAAGGLDLRVPLFLMDLTLTSSDYGSSFQPVAPVGGYISFTTPNS